MYDVQDLPESKLEALLTDLGLLASLDIGGVMVAPLIVQIGSFNPAAIDDNERIIAIITNGENNTTDPSYFDHPNFTLHVSSKADRSDIINAKMIANLINDTLKDYKTDAAEIVEGGVFGVETTGIQGPFYEDDGRVIYEVSGRLFLNR